MSENQNVAPDNEKAGIGAYIALLFACVFFSGVLAGNHWYGIFDFGTMNGAFGKLAAGVTQANDTLQVATANFRGKGGSGAIDGFCFALTLVPTVMFALAMITVLEHYGALVAARKLLNPILRPILGLPGSCSMALIASLQSTDGGAALTRQLLDAGEITEDEADIFAMFQLSADATITNFMGAGVVLLSLTNAAGETVPASIGLCFVVMFGMKFVGANFVRFLKVFRSKKAA